MISERNYQIKNKTENEIRTFLTSYFEQALQLIVRQIQMEDYHIDDEQLFADFC